MPLNKKPSADDLAVPSAARFTKLARRLTKTRVNAVFDDVLKDTAATQVSRSVREVYGSTANQWVVSFLCFKTSPEVAFLVQPSLSDTRYGFTLLVERRGYLAVLHQLAKGLDSAVTRLSEPLDRRKITHIWSDGAKYQRFGTRRMTVAMQELRGASYEADDLETAFVPAAASRTIIQTLSLTTRQHGAVSITPSTGRVRVRAGRVAITDLLDFVDGALDAYESSRDSAFLSAFAMPVDVAHLDTSIVPSGLLFDREHLASLLRDPSCTLATDEGARTPDELLDDLSVVYELKPDGDGWTAITGAGARVAQVKRLKHSFGVYTDLAKGFTLDEGNGQAVPLDRWIRDERAFSLSFSSPEHFYAQGSLYRTAGFEEEAKMVRTFLRPEQSLTDVTSEKGGRYAASASRFGGKTIFRILEDEIAATDTHLWCCDLGDEWADYIGASADGVNFYHCKHGQVTSGASDLQTVTAQALKNLGRIKFRQEDLRQKLTSAAKRNLWGQTQISLLPRGPQGWGGLELDLQKALASPNTRWRVNLVVTALSVSNYDDEAARTAAKPYFVQLVWLLSSFVSSCRERGAEAVIVCRP